MIIWTQIFEVVSELDNHNKTIYRLKFKNDGTIMKAYMSTRRTTVETFAHKWVEKNQEEATNILFEIEVLDG